MTLKENYPDTCVCCGNHVSKGTMVCADCKLLNVAEYREKAERRAKTPVLTVDFKRVFAKYLEKKNGDPFDKNGNKP